MPLVMQDLGELAYGGLVAGTKRWDTKRISEGKIKNTDLVKKAGFYAYLVPGVISTGAVAFGMLRRYEAWTERLAHGFIYGFPEFAWDMMDTFKKSAGNNPVQEQADRILASNQARKRSTGAYQFDNVRLT